MDRGDDPLNGAVRSSPGRPVDVTARGVRAVRPGGMLRVSRAAVAASVVGLLAAPLAAALPTQPPPASLTVGSKTIRLALGSYCWSKGGRANCVDMIPPAQRSDIPAVSVRRGTSLEIVLGFTARAWKVQRLASASAVKPAPGRTATIRASGTGIYEIFVEKSANGSVSYLFRLRLR